MIQSDNDVDISRQLIVELRIAAVDVQALQFQKLTEISNDDNPVAEVLA